MSSAICIYLWCTLEKAMAPHSSTLAWKIPWMEESDRLQSMGLLRVGHDWATSLSLFHFPALEKEMATHSSVFPGESQRRGSLVGSWWALDGVAQSRTRLKQLSSSSSMMYLQKLPCGLLRCVCVCVLRFSLVQFSRSVISDSLGPHESQHARPPCPSPTPGVHSDSCPSSQWCHPAISSSVIPFSFCPQSLPVFCGKNT